MPYFGFTVLCNKCSERDVQAKDKCMLLVSSIPWRQKDSNVEILVDATEYSKENISVPIQPSDYLLNGYLWSQF